MVNERNTRVRGSQIKEETVTKGDMTAVGETEGFVLTVQADETVDFEDSSGLAAVIRNEINIVLNAFRIAINGSLTQFNMVDGIVDEYEDESSIDVGIVQSFAHMALEDNTDDGSGANAVTDIGTPTYSSGKLNNAIELDGSTDALNLDALQADIASDTTGSIAMWIEPDVVNSTDFFFTLSDASASTALRMFVQSNGTVRAVLSISGATQWQITSTTALSADTYYHITVVQDGVSPELHINGTEEGTLDVSVDTTAWMADLTNSDVARLGCENFNSGGNTRFFDGQIDDFRYYQNKALTQAEIDLIYNSGTGSESSTFGNSANISYDSVNDLYSPSKDSLTVSPFTHLKLENSTDDGTGANSFTDIGTPTYTAGHLNNAIELDGSTDALNADALQSDTSSDTSGSISFWVNADTGANGAVFHQGNSGSSNEFYFGVVAGGSMEFIITVASSNILVYLIASIPANTWKHVVVTQDGIQAKIYIDAEEIAPTKSTDTTPGAWLANPSTNIGRIGCRNFNSGGNSAFFDGQIDDLRYYQNKALTQAEIDAIYNSGTGTEDDLPEGAANNMTLISEVFTAEAAPDNTRIVLFEEDVDSVTLNTDLKVFSTRDAGQTFTTDFATDDKLDITAHGFSNTDRIKVTSSSQDLPAGLDSATIYYVINSTANDFELSLTSGGAAVELTDNGTGTHTAKQVSKITLVNEGQYESGRNILTASVDISGQASGTSMEYIIVTDNNKDLKIHGTGLAWD